MANWRVGEVTITRILESMTPTSPQFLFPQLEGDALGQIPWLQPDFVTRDGQVLLAIQALVVETPSSRIVIDTCVGNDRKGRGNRSAVAFPIPELTPLMIATDSDMSVTPDNIALLNRPSLSV
jgi:hypothetical protein